MDFLRTRGLRLCRLLERPIHIGSDDQAKGLPKHHISRDFAVVLAQTSAPPAYLVFFPHIQSNRPRNWTIERFAAKERRASILTRCRIAIDGLGDKPGAGGGIIGRGGGCLGHAKSSIAEAAADRAQRCAQGFHQQGFHQQGFH
jgi:hypothetical protein